MSQLFVRVTQTGVSASQAAIRTHSVTIDRPGEKGGSDAGPMGGELFLTGLGGCFMSNLLAAIRARESTIRGVAVELTSRVDGTPAKFVEITLKVSAAEGDRAELEKLVLIAERSCIVANSLKGHIPVRIEIA